MKFLRVSLTILAGLILLVVLLLIGGRVYGQWRMNQVTQDLASLARELGYTPDAHLHHEITVRDVSLVTGSAYCSISWKWWRFSHLGDLSRYIQRHARSAFRLIQSCSLCGLPEGAADPRHSDQLTKIPEAGICAD